MKSIKLDRLVESHEMELSKELLDMTVGEMLNRMSEIDTHGDAEYEIIEDALRALSNKLMSSGYDSEKSLDFGSVESDDAEKEVDFTEEEDESMPTFGDIESKSMSNQRPEENIGDWTF